MRVETDRLVLVAATTELLRADLDGPAALAGALGVAVPASWPPDYYERDDVERALAFVHGAPGWSTWYLIERAAAGGRLVGVCGFGGPPSADGTVVLGYSIVSDARRRGYATEATRALVRHAFDDQRVERVVAETFPALVGSIGVLEKSGFHRTAEPVTPAGTIRFTHDRPHP
jgi:RimJ/RimL family protein N-acetyltransferase